MHLGTAFLVAMFLCWARDAGSLDFDRLLGRRGAGRVLFLLAVVGFGTKAGFMPLHVWLPEAHPAAPSHVSAVMSGVMIKTGIYGLLRTLTLLGPPPAWWGWTLLGIGVGVRRPRRALRPGAARPETAAGLPQRGEHRHHRPRPGRRAAGRQLPATRSWRPSGSPAGCCTSSTTPSSRACCFSAPDRCCTPPARGEIDRLGGLLKRMPVTGATFLVGAAAISGLPPL